MIITYNGIEFETNPNQASEAMQFKGNVYSENTCNTAISPIVSIFGFDKDEIFELSKEFKKIEDNAFVVQIFGPGNIYSPRNYVDTIYL